MNPTRLFGCALFACIALAVTPLAHAIRFADPDRYHVKRTWSAASLGIPVNLGGLMFSGRGSTLYVVGASETATSALYAVPITRDARTGEVAELGPAAKVVKVFDGTKAGLDAGLDFGPAGTFFYTYWSANFLGERPGGVGGRETMFDMGAVGVPSSVAGLTFSPHIRDPRAGFQLMQVSSWLGKNIYDVPLIPKSGGIFAPGPVTLFVTLPQEGTGAIQYVPSGPLAGHLMYVNWDYGQVRVLAIDGATGLPIDRETRKPTRGTATPWDMLFVDDLGAGPWGLEFDLQTNDFFLGTWGGTPANTIIQIGGSGFPAPKSAKGK